MGVNFFDLNDRDARFLLFEHLKVDQLTRYDRYGDFDPKSFKKVVTMSIKEALKVCREVMGPAFQDGDEQGCTLNNGFVTVPDAYQKCWKVLSENDWLSIANTPEYGGQGLPFVVAGVINEFFYGANPAMMIYGGLTVGAAHLIESFGTEKDKARFVEKMYTGTWGGTMCLTEPDAGSDVGWMLTEAEPDPDAVEPNIYKISGNKQFISGGHQNMTENIIHLVLARIKGAPMGTKGLSLFIVPNIWVNADGSLGEKNDVQCTGIEHKMGVHGQATCSMSYGPKGACRGILLGEPGSGIIKMFQLMNEYRMFTGSQALGQASCAYAVAKEYAKSRIQGTPYTAPRADRVPLVQHEDIRRMLMNLKAGTEAMRAMVAKAFYQIDIAGNEKDRLKREKAFKQSDLLIPVVKAYCTDYSNELIADAMQIMGGVGYCKEFPIEQYARDCKITTIVEGTNFIQSKDLIKRKLNMDKGEVFRSFVQDVLDFAETNIDDPDFGSDFKLLVEATEATEEMAAKIRDFSQKDQPRLAPFYATRFLKCVAELFMSQLLLEQGLIAREKFEGIKSETADGIFYKGKMETARYFCRNMLPNIFGRLVAASQADSSALDIPESAL